MNPTSFDLDSKIRNTGKRVKAVIRDGKVVNFLYIKCYKFITPFGIKARQLYIQIPLQMQALVYDDFRCWDLIQFFEH